MGSSLVLTGGASVTKTLKETITQTSHGFAVGDVVRWDGTLSPPKYTKARADSALNSEVAGVVNTVADANNFELTYHGYIEVAAFSALTDPVMFLSADTAGGLTASPPSAVGTVVKPVLTKNTNGSGYLVMNYLGTQIGGSSTVAVDEIQPVGTIMPYAGTAIPDTWLACDGASYAISDYPELYNRTRYTTGAGVPLHGYIIELGMNSSASVYYTNLAIGNILLFKDGGSPTSTSYDNIGVVVSKTAPNIASPGAYPVTVKILPKYDSTLKKFAFANHLVTNTTGIVPFTNETLATLVTSATASAHTSNYSVVVHALCPDLRGRTVVGTNASGYTQTDGDAGLASAVGVYDLGQQGGEESHILTTAEIPSHTHSATVTVTDPGHTHGMTFDNNNQNGLIPNGGDGTNITGASQVRNTTSNKTNISVSVSNSNTGSDTPHNNMPPYLAVRYIIKAKPYTRAAIVDGIDLPYTSLLVRDLRSRNVGGSNGDLVFYTNTSGDSGNGTERMRVLGSGGTVVVGITSSASNILSANSAGLYITNTTKNSLADLYVENSDANLSTGGGITLASFVCSALGSTQRRPRLHINATDEGIILNESYNLETASNLMFAIGNVEKMRLTATGLGVLTNSPGATLDVNGTLKVGNFGGTTNVMPKAQNSLTSSVVGNCSVERNSRFSWGEFFQCYCCNRNEQQRWHCDIYL